MAISARDQAALEATAAELTSETGRRIVPIRADTRSDEDVRAMVRRAASDLGRLDILVNNAAKAGGQAPVPKLSDITQELLWEDVDTKVMGYLRCAREAAPYMIERGWGRIINISGMAARQTGSTIGSIRNVAVSAITKNLADELGPHGINVTVVHPGLTRTEATAGVVADRARAQGVSEEEEVEARNGPGQLGASYSRRSRDRPRCDLPCLAEGRRHHRRRHRSRRRRGRRHPLLGRGETASRLLGAIPLAAGSLRSF